MSPQRSVSSRAVTAILITAAIVAAGYALRHTVSCFLLSFIIAYLLDPAVVALERRRIPRTYGIIILYLTLALISVFSIIYILPFTTLAWESLLRDLPGYVQKGKDLILGGKGELQPAFGNEEWHWLMDTIWTNMDKLYEKLSAGVYAAAANVVFNLFNLILSPILVFFMLYYKHQIIDECVSWLPVERSETIRAIGREINASVGGYIRGQLIVSVIVAVLSTIALFLLGIDYAILNGIFAGLASILPFIGVILATLPPLFFAYVEFQSGVVLIKVAASFAVIYFLEGYVVKPLVFQESMDLNPLLTIIVVMAFGELLGFWGIILAIPLAAAFKIVSAQIRRDSFAREP
ncbi:AI-2E family transporter [Geotalea toluenoxydans]|uniref:AI-2E family transporter n=1 Tax=Geotalea toluenoxydans TaxID=421624 RepID=UPI0006D15459|nr:AI-2E family transporter [Geotalea toluenoxydans]